MSDAAGTSAEASPRRRSTFLPRVPERADETVRLDGRRVLVIGAQAGIGAQIAVALARAGALLALSYAAKDRGRGRLLASIVRQIGPATIELEGDLADPAVARQLPRLAVAAFDGLDVLIQSPPEQDADAVPSIEDGVLATVRIARAAASTLAPGSRILYITMRGAAAGSGPLDGAATDAVVEGWTRGLASGLADLGIGVVTVSVPPAPDEPDRSPLLPDAGRLTDEIARTVVLLASAHPRVASGETVRVRHAVSAW